MNADQAKTRSIAAQRRIAAANDRERAKQQRHILAERKTALEEQVPHVMRTVLSQIKKAVERGERRVVQTIDYRRGVSWVVIDAIMVKLRNRGFTVSTSHYRRDETIDVVLEEGDYVTVTW